MKIDFDKLIRSLLTQANGKAGFEFRMSNVLNALAEQGLGFDGKNFYCFSSCSLINNNFYANDKEPFSSACFAPATKEQRNKLEKGIHEAGYEWDSNKLKLKKISTTDEQEIDIDGMVEEYRKAQNEYILSKEFIDTKCKVYRKGLEDMYNKLK